MELLKVGDNWACAVWSLLKMTNQRLGFGFWKIVRDFWDLLEIEPFLESSGFQTLDFLSKKRDRLGGTSWIFRGSRADAETYLQLFFEGEAGDSSGKFLVCEIVTRDRRNATNTKLQSETRVSLKPTKVFDLSLRKIRTKLWSLRKMCQELSWMVKND